MRVSSKFAPLAALIFGLLVLVPSPVWATMTKNCPPEPMTGVPIVSGETYWGSNCALYTVGDVDSFQFNASAGDIWSVVLGYGQSPTTVICLSLYAPGSQGSAIFSGCTNGTAIRSAGTTQKLALGGTYTVVVTEASTATMTYGLSLERITPPPPDAIPLVLSKEISGEINPPTAQDAYSFYGDTSGTYEIVLNDAGGSTCFSVYEPNGTAVVSEDCTNGVITPVSADVTPTANGTYVVVVNDDGNDGINNYSLDVSCLLGKCITPPPPPPPRCTLSDIATYNPTTSTLTMKFSVGNNLGAAANWSAWLTYADPQGTDLDTIQNLFSVSQPITNPPKPITKAFTGLPKEGNVVVLSTLSTPKNGIACSSLAQVNTGTEP